jgi:acid phosphatase family membrane protein YuiD
LKYFWIALLLAVCVVTFATALGVRGSRSKLSLLNFLSAKVFRSGSTSDWRVVRPGIGKN